MSSTPPMSLFDGMPDMSGTADMGGMAAGSGGDSTGKVGIDGIDVGIVDLTDEAPSSGMSVGMSGILSSGTGEAPSSVTSVGMSGGMSSSVSDGMSGIQSSGAGEAPSGGGSVGVGMSGGMSGETDEYMPSDGCFGPELNSTDEATSGSMSGGVLQIIRLGIPRLGTWMEQTH
jgi:hypothetical protein